MKKQAVFSVLLIFLFAFLLLISGLKLSEQGLQQILGRQEPAGAFRLFRNTDGFWTLTFGGKDWVLGLEQLKKYIPAGW